MKRAAGRVVFAFASLLALLALSQVVLYNLRLHRTLQLQQISGECASLEREVEELQNQATELLSPTRLEAIGERLGLAPMPLERLAVQDGGMDVDIMSGEVALAQPR
mgnify:FL=1